MNETFHCEDRDALVAYLYDECDPAERAAIAAHVSHCPACAEEIASLRATRTQLAAWMPPAASLGFQITRADQRNEPLAFASRASDTPPAGAPEPHSWWREPLPAWAQAAAAALIFAAGLTAGTLGRGSERDAVIATAPVASPVSTAAPAQATSRQPSAGPSASAVSVAELARLEQRLRAIESAQAVNASGRTVSAASIAGSGQMTPGSVLALIDQRVSISEDRLAGNIALVAAAARDIESQVRSMQRQDRTVSVTAEELRQNRESGELLTRPVSFRGR